MGDDYNSVGLAGGLGQGNLVSTRIILIRISYMMTPSTPIVRPLTKSPRPP